MLGDDATPHGPERFRVLIVMDDHPLTKVVVLALKHGTYEVRIERTFAEAKLAVAEMRPHLAIIDIQADEGRTIELVDDQVDSRRLPTLALTRRDDLQKNLAVIDRGADDILTIPFLPAELVTRVRAAIRRTYGERVHFVPVIRIGDLSIDILNRRVRIGDSEIHLTGLEQALLYLLAANSGTIVTRDLILDALWGPDFVTETNVVERHIRALRVKLRDDFNKTPYIQTVHGEGYRFVSQGG
ncbi:MAG: two-component system, OmpR family, operon response regulator KdpE [Chloroflexota bacterium]|jgi:two-component system KDP operon response regulator KdpE|nr:two-component system, OmpR family, operon response regulator KdpE [Chloroflexota bacterium]